MTTETERKYTPEETKENRQKWIKALRSGKYEQIQGDLRYKDAFCCMGVACEISGLGEWDKHNLYLDEGMVLPTPVLYWLGLKSNEGAFAAPEDKYGYRTLTGYNDEGKTFEVIAAIIEAEPNELLHKENDNGVHHRRDEIKSEEVGRST